MNLDKVKAKYFYQDDGDKTLLNWCLYEYANILYEKVEESPRLANYRKNHSANEIETFCVYFSKRLRKSLNDEQTGRTEGVIIDARYVYEFYPKNTYRQTQRLLEVALSAWNEHALICSNCPNQCLIHRYDTPMRCAEKYEYKEDGEAVLMTAEDTTFKVNIRTYSNEKDTYYTVNPGKGDDGIIRDGLLPRFSSGILGHDHDKKFYKYSLLHATCCEHLLRDLKGLHDLYNCPWAEDFRTFLKDMNAHKKYDIALGINKCEESFLINYSERYDTLVRNGELVLDGMIPGTFGYDELRKMLARLQNYKDAYLLFIRNYNAPFTSNFH